MNRFLVLAAALAAHAATADAQTYRAQSVQFSMLPSSRSVAVGETATVFGTALSNISQTDCELVLGDGAPGATLSWRLLDANNQLTADAPNTHFPLTGANGANPGGVPQNLLVAISSPTPLNNADVDIFTRCANTTANPPFDYYRNPRYPGVNTLLLNAGAAATPDILAIGQSLTADGYVRLPTAGARRPAAIAAVNIGAPGTVTVTANTGSIPLPVEVTVCETDSNGVCTGPRAASLDVAFATNQVRTFNVYVQSNGQHGVADLPALARVYFQFGLTAPAGDTADGGDVSSPAVTLATRYGMTSFAVLAAPPESAGEQIGGVYRGFIVGGAGGPFGTFPATIVIPNPSSSVIYVSQSDGSGWGSTSQGAILGVNAQTGGRAMSQSAVAYANGQSSQRQGGLNRNTGNIYPRAGINGNVPVLASSPYTFTYQGVYDPIAEQTISGNLTPDGTAIVGQAFDIFYQGNDIGDLQTGETTPNGSSVGSATVTFPGQSAPCEVTVVNQRMSSELTTWRFSFGNFNGCPMPRYEGGGYVDDTQGARRVYLNVFALELVDDAVDMFPLVLVAK